MLRREMGKITVKEYFIPCYVFDEIGTGRYRVVPLDGLLNGGIGCEKLEQARDYIRSRIGPDLPELPTGAITLTKACAGLPFPEMQTCAAAAYAVGREEGMADDAVRKIIGQFSVQGYTQNVLVADNATLILNMNCKSGDSFASALKVLAEKSGRKLAILSDWDTETNWQQVIKSAFDAGASSIFCLSEQAKNACAAYKNVFVTADERELEKLILPYLQEGDTVLFDGGRNSNINITLRRIFGLTDGFIPDAW